MKIAIYPPKRHKIQEQRNETAHVHMEKSRIFLKGDNFGRHIMGWLMYATIIESNDKFKKQKKQDQSPASE